MSKRCTYDWHYHIQNQATSGLSIKEYSRQEGFSAWSFYMNRKRLHTVSSIDSPQTIQPLQSQEVNKASFLQLGSLETQNELTVTFSNGTTVKYRGILSANSLTELLCTMYHTKRGRRAT